MKIVLYCHDSSLNDATLYYIKLIEKSVNRLGIQIHFCHTLDNLRKNDIIFTITSKYYIKAKVKYPFSKTMFWAQGLGPEEYLLSGNNIFKYRLKKIIECISIKNSDLLFVVSNKMLEHFKDSYSYRKKNYIIIPCYNLSYKVGIVKLTSKRYEAANFVYAGNLATWQCVEESLVIFKSINKEIKNATMTLLVKDVDVASELIKKHSVHNVNIKYVEVSKLQDELTKYKYGFIIRENILVNNVSTPTKMNSYLASGVIPIYTDAVHSFRENINLNMKHSLCLSSSSTIDEKVKKILKFDKHLINPTHLDNNIHCIFNEYYNDETYIDEVVQTFSRIFKVY